MKINENMKVLLPQPIETEAISLLEKKNCIVTTAPDPKPKTVLPLLKDAHGFILRTGIAISRELIENAEPKLINPQQFRFDSVHQFLKNNFRPLTCFFLAD